jgi:mRNA interferase MazF
MRRGEIWFAATPGGAWPVLVLARDPVAGWIGAVVVAALTRAVRGLVSELELTPDDGVPSRCVANFDNLHPLPKDAFWRRVAKLPASRISQVCRVLPAATGCGKARIATLRRVLIAIPARLVSHGGRLIMRLAPDRARCPASWPPSGPCQPPPASDPWPLASGRLCQVFHAALPSRARVM